MKILRQGYRHVGPRVLFVLLIIVMRLIEADTIKSTLKEWAYTFVHWELTWFFPRDGGIVIVDIAALPPEDGVTPRRQLLDLMTQLKDAGARAIGVDIDFSPENSLFVAPGDPRFFQDCLNLHIPVFLGVARTAGNGREAWLGKREFADLAAGIVIPERSGKATEDEGAPGPYPLFIPLLDGISRLNVEGVTNELDSMAVTLARVRNPGIKQEMMTSGRISEPVVEHPVIKGVAVPEFPVNYNFVGALQRASIAAKWDSAGKLLPLDRAVTGQTVLIGDLKGSSQSDVFATQGSTASASGVLIHASAALTLNKPLSVLKWWVQTALELVLVGWIGAALRKSRKTLTPKQQWRLQARRWGLAAALLVAAVGFSYQGIIWLDWLPVAVVAVVHTFLERYEIDEAVEDSKESSPQVASTS